MWCLMMIGDRLAHEVGVVNAERLTFTMLLLWKLFCWSSSSPVGGAIVDAPVSKEFGMKLIFNLYPKHLKCSRFHTNKYSIFNFF